MVSCITNRCLSTSNKQDGWDNCVCSINFFQLGNHRIISYSALQKKNSHRQPKTFHLFPCRTEYFKNSFFVHVIIEWNKLDPNICSFGNYHIFCNALLKSIRPVKRKIFDINDSYGIKILTRLRLGFSHLLEYKSRRSFKDIKCTMLKPQHTISCSATFIIQTEPPLWITWKIFPFLFLQLVITV